MNVMNEFQYFLSTEAMVDVTIACDGQSLNAHKIVLAAYSLFFRALFTKNPCKHPIVILKDIKYTELKLVIDFMYSGEVNVTEDQLLAVIKTAQALKVKGLGEIMVKKHQSNGKNKTLSYVGPNTLISKVLKNQSGDLYNFKWNIHVNVMDELKNFLSNETMVDVTLICEEQSLKGHKIMLAAYSPFFRSLFLKNPCKHPTVILNDVKYSDLRSVINFMYCSEKISDEQISTVIKIAHTLKVKGLVEFESHNNPSSSYESENVIGDNSENQLNAALSQQPTCMIDVSNWTLIQEQSRNGQNETGECTAASAIKQEIIPNDTDLYALYTNTSTVFSERQDTNPFAKSQQNRAVEDNVDKDFALGNSFEGATVNTILLQTSMTDNKQVVPLNKETASSSICIMKCPDENKANKSKKFFPLPEFSPNLKPLLNGDKLSIKQHSVLSSALKDQLISYLNREKLICTGSSSALRWQYRNLGESLSKKYPKMVFDLPSHRQKKSLKKDAPIYSIFIRRLSERRKMQRLRQKSKETDHFAVNGREVEKAKEKTIDDFAVDMSELEVIEMSPEDALDELYKTVTPETVRNKENLERINELLKISFDIRKKDNLSELPPYLMAQKCLETDVELHFASTMAEMEKKIQGVLLKMSSAYSVPGTVLELEKLMQPETATCSAITMGECTSKEKRPGPSIFYGSDKLLLCKEQHIYLEEGCSLERAVILLLGVYYILNLNFPAEYHQFLCFLENIVVKTKRSPMQFYTPHLIQIINNLCS